MSLAVLFRAARGSGFSVRSERSPAAFGGRVARAMPKRRHFIVLAVRVAVAAGAPATAADPPAPVSTTLPARAPAQGVAVLGVGSARAEAFVAARAVYGSSVRPRALDEVRARILAGDPAPSVAGKELRDLAELRASVKGDDAASRQLLSAMAPQLNVEGLLVISRVASTDASSEDAGAPTVTVAGRLFLTEIGDFDAARYEADAASPTPWRATVTSLSGRFPPPPAVVAHPYVPPKHAAAGGESKPFYASPWLWGAVGAAALIGAIFFLTTQDTGDDPIHLQLRVPR